MRMSWKDARNHAKRHNRLEVKVSDEELAVIKKKAETANLSVAAYMRKMATLGEIKIFDTKNWSLLRESINRVGNNINQIAMVANSTKSISSGEITKVVNAQKLLEELLNEYYELIAPKVM